MRLHHHDSSYASVNHVAASRSLLHCRHKHRRPMCLVIDHAHELEQGVKLQLLRLAVDGAAAGTLRVVFVVDWYGNWAPDASCLWKAYEPAVKQAHSLCAPPIEVTCADISFEAAEAHLAARLGWSSPEKKAIASESS